MLKKLFVVGGLMFLLVGCNTEQGTKEEVTDTKQVAQAQDMEDSEVEDFIFMGEPAVIGDVTYSVTEVKVLDTVADYTSENGVYVTVKIEVENNSNEAVDLSNGDFTIIQNDAVYEHDPTTTRYHDKGFTFEKLNPNMSMSASIVYEMPRDVTEYSAMLRIVPNQFKKDEVAFIVLANRP